FGGNLPRSCSRLYSRLHASGTRPARQRRPVPGREREWEGSRHCPRSEEIMSERVTLDLPDELAQRARATAAEAKRPFEEVLVDWLRSMPLEPPIESLPDDQILALCDSQIDSDQQEALSDLLARNQEGLPGEPERGRLDELMRSYRRGLIRKAQALHTAVKRGLRSRLN